MEAKPGGFGDYASLRNTDAAVRTSVCPFRRWFFFAKENQSDQSGSRLVPPLSKPD